MGGLVLHTGTVSHPLLGQAHVIEHAGRPITAMSAIDWERPAQIPTIAEPRALPPGAGTLLINEIARRAQAAGVQALRYAGPYPTHALFASLLRSFRTTGTVEQFTAQVLERAMTLASDEVPIDFTPAPFVRRDHVDLRDGAIDRVRLVGVTYDVHGEHGSLALLAGARAILTVGVPIAHVAYLRADGELLDGPNAIPTFTTPANGTTFPDALKDELADAAVGYVPPPLADDIGKAIRTRRIIWDDLGWRAARITDDGFAIHVAFLALAKDHMEVFAQQLSHHLAMIAQQAVLAELQASRRP